jgi:3-hydroxybutyryl-CoA dehydrogenase
MNRLGVVGCGLMGSGIAEVGAKSGCDVLVVDTNDDILGVAQKRMQASLAKQEEKGKLKEPADIIFGRITFTTDLKAMGDREIVIEAIRESIDDKAALLAKLDDIVSDGCIVASNTSSIPIATIAAASKRPDRIVGAHFFNPVPVMPLVEVISALQTNPAIADATHEFCANVLGKKVIRATDQAGFVVNALLVPYLLDAIRMLQNGIASKEDIDEGMVGGCSMPIGPIALCDLIGLDTLLLVAESLYAEHLDPGCAAPALLRRHVEAGMLGRKSGKGFYTY